MTKNHDTMNLLTAMFKENTGIALCDSGDAYGRAWQINATKDLNAEPDVTLDGVKDGVILNDTELTSISWTVNCYKYLNEVLELDDACYAFNELQDAGAKADGRHGDRYGVYEGEAEEYLTEWFEERGEVWNTYNGDCTLSQTLQGQHLAKDGVDYVLLQVHGGCDVRGGYTDAKLFKLGQWVEYIDSCPHVAVDITLPDGREVSAYDEGGCTLITEDDEWDGKIPEGSKISISLSL